MRVNIITHESPMEYLIVIASLFLIYVLIQTIFQFGKPKNKNLPPGPTSLPIIGNLHLVGDQPHRSLAKLAKIHGPIMSLKLGQTNTVVISSNDVAKEVLRKQDLIFSTRNIPIALHAHQYSNHSIAILPVDAQWRTLRKIVNSNISSPKSLEASQHLRSEKVKELVAYCKKASQSNDSVDIGAAVFRTLLNLISNTIFSKNLLDPYDDSGKEFKVVFGNIMEEAGKANIVDFFPAFRNIDPQGISRRLSHYLGKILDILEGLIKERSESTPILKQGDDLLDVCLKIIQDSPHELSATHMKILIFDMFAAGTDTTTNTFEWAMTEVLSNPHTMVKAKQELEEVVGRGKLVQEDDVMRLPYLQCIVKETLRMHPPLPFLVPRKVESQTTLNGYTILEGTQVLVNAWAIGRDPKIWEDSHEFKPERFLESLVDVRGQDFELIPFGAGRRKCPGMPLAMFTIPMMLGSLLNNFDWNHDMRTEPKAFDMTEKFGFTVKKANPLCVIPKQIHL